MCALDGVCDVEKELQVHGRLGHAGAAPVDDGDQSAVQLVHVALGQQAATAAGLVLHLDGGAEDESHNHDRDPDRGPGKRYHVGLG